MLSKPMNRVLQMANCARRTLGGGLMVVSVLLGTAHAAQLTLNWTDASSNEDGFHIQRKTGTGGAYGTIATPPAGTTGYVDGTVTAGTTYCYRVSAYNTAGDSSYSNEACAAPVAATTHAVTVTKAGSGTGTVASSPAGITCGTDCTEAYAAGTSVGLSATPATGSTFTGWSGAYTGTGGCALVVDGPKSLTATFALQTYALSVAKSGTGTGTVTATGINCGADCTETYNYNTSVTLTAAATTGSTFTGWSGACSGTGTCAVTMTTARTVTATFTPNAPTTYTLSVTKAGTGAGTVTSNVAGINCGSDCSQTYASTTSVTLTAAPAAGTTFAGWSGACSGTGTCAVTMSAARSVTATFTTNSAPTVTLATNRTSPQVVGNARHRHRDGGGSRKPGVPLLAPQWDRLDPGAGLGKQHLHLDPCGCRELLPRRLGEAQHGPGGDGSRDRDAPVRGHLAYRDPRNQPDEPPGRGNGRHRHGGGGQESQARCTASGSTMGPTGSWCGTGEAAPTLGPLRLPGATTSASG